MYSNSSRGFGEVRNGHNLFLGNDSGEDGSVTFWRAGISSHVKTCPSNTRMQHDRFAREIIGILAPSCAARSRRLMRNPLGGPCAVAFLIVQPISTPSRQAQLYAKHHRSCSSQRSAPALCSIVCEIRSSMPISPQCRPFMLRSLAKGHRACSSRQNAITPCSIVCERSSFLLISAQRHHVMANWVQDVIAHAHLAATPARHALWRAERHRATCRPAQQARVADAATRRARSGLF